MGSPSNRAHAHLHLAEAHLPSEWQKQDEARRMGKPYIPADMAEPGKRERWLNALALQSTGAAAANKGGN